MKNWLDVWAGEQIIRGKLQLLQPLLSGKYLTQSNGASRKDVMVTMSIYAV